MHSILRHARRNLQKAQKKQKEIFDVKRRRVKFRVGQRVFLSSRALPSSTFQEGSARLAPRWFGPFQVLKKVNDNAYVLQLTGDLRKLHNTFNVEFLRKAHGV